VDWLYSLSGSGRFANAFKIISIKDDSPYLKYFLDFYKQEIIKFFPDADMIRKIQEGRENSVNLIILRNAAVAGIFIGQKSEDSIMVDLDFVIPEFRDFKTGQFLFGHSHDTFKKLRVKSICSNSFSPEYLQYLERIGFKKQTTAAGEEVCEKTIA